jgi:CMP-N,N'-diacetyllegionaminic acid synthase
LAKIVTADFLIVVPARGGSKRLPGKNLKNLAGLSLLAHTAKAIEAANMHAPVLLSTDDEKIAAEGARLGWDVPFRRPVDLAGDDAASTDVVLHALDWYSNTHGAEPSAIMVLQATSPFRGGACIREAVRLLESRADIDSVIAMTESHISPSQHFIAAEDGAGIPVADDWRCPVYRPNGALYLTRTAALRRAHSLYAGKIAPLVINGIRAIDIDTELDFKLAEAALEAGLPPEPTAFSSQTSRVTSPT